MRLYSGTSTDFIDPFTKSYQRWRNATLSRSRDLPAAISPKSSVTTEPLISSETLQSLDNKRLLTAMSGLQKI
jgi:hypothetical protein